MFFDARSFSGLEDIFRGFPAELTSLRCGGPGLEHITHRRWGLGALAGFVSILAREAMPGKLLRKQQRDFEDGTRYDGGWERGVFHGEGTLTWGRLGPGFRW